MLRHTFIHIPGIGPKTEQGFWAAGVHDWDAFFDDASLKLSASRRAAISETLIESRRQLDGCNPDFFARRIPASQQWRLFGEFRNRTAYLDIETTGLESWDNTITTIAVYDGHSIRHYVNGRNLDDFVGDIQKYGVLVTYNGKTFDVPFIQDYFGITLHQAHIDLRYILSSLGYKGGLKSCERQLGMDRGGLADIDGYFAVMLWDEYQKKGDEKTIETLLAYNIQDVLNLEYLMVTAYNRKIRGTPFFATQLPEPASVENPFAADRKTVDRIKEKIRSAPVYFS